MPSSDGIKKYNRTRSEMWKVWKTRRGVRGEIVRYLVTHSLERRGETILLPTLVRYVYKDRVTRNRLSAVTTTISSCKKMFEEFGLKIIRLIEDGQSAVRLVRMDDPEYGDELRTAVRKDVKRACGTLSHVGVVLDNMPKSELSGKDNDDLRAAQRLAHVSAPVKASIELTIEQERLALSDRRAITDGTEQE